MQKDKLSQKKEKLIQEKKAFEFIDRDVLAKLGTEKLSADKKLTKKYMFPSETKVLNMMRKYSLYFYEIYNYQSYQYF